MIAFIYAAGRSLRLGKAFAEKQKILLEFSGKSILEWHANRLTQVGIKKMVVVTGYTREKVREAFPSLNERYGISIIEVVNRDYKQGSVLSVHVSLPEILKATGSVLIMDGDVLYPTEILQKLIISKHPTALLIDRHYTTQDDDPVLVPVRNGRPFEFLKGWTGDADLVGESIGFFKIDSCEIPLFVEETRKRSVGERRRESYDEIIRALVQEDRFGYEDVTGVPWTEIDFPEDVTYARNSIFPAILSYEKSKGALKQDL